MARAQYTREDFVGTALTFIDEHGYEALTLRSLGELVGASHTALYRHFTDRDALLTAVADTLVAEAMAVPPSDGAAPRDRVAHRFHRIKTVFSAHPNVAVPTATTGGPRPAHLAWSREVIADLEAMGLAGDGLVLAFRLLESYGAGTTVFDLGGAPDHLELRRRRLRALEHPDFDAACRTSEDIAAQNDAAFALGLRVLLDACEALAVAR